MSIKVAAMTKAAAMMFVLLLAACAPQSLPPLPLPLSPVPYAEEPDYAIANEFQLSAAVVVLPPAAQRKPKRRFNLTWKRSIENERTYNELLVKGPFGNTHARLVFSTSPSGQAGTATLWWEGKKHTDSSIAALARRLLGFAAPINSFAYWLHGVSDPNHSTRETTKAGGEIIAIAQQDWRVEIQQRDEATNRPLELLLHAPQQQGMLKMSIKQWSPNP